MKGPTKAEVTQLLSAWNLGDRDAAEDLIPAVYGELKKLARHYMAGERAGHLLQTTALINEAYLRLSAMERIEWQNRNQFFGVAAQIMRRILVDFARSRNAQKRGGRLERVTLDEKRTTIRMDDPFLEELDEALYRLASIDQRKSKVVELRYFGGFNVKETAEILGVSPETVLRDWRFAKAWLLNELSRS